MWQAAKRAKVYPSKLQQGIRQHFGHFLSSWLMQVTKSARKVQEKKNLSRKRPRRVEEN
jgi:hypothetical protein